LRCSPSSAFFCVAVAIGLQVFIRLKHVTSTPDLNRAPIPLYLR
jgi:hypothetical protein